MTRFPPLRRTLPAALGLLALATAGTAAPVQERATEPAAPWPESAQGRPLPRPAWVLVIPARRAADGSLSIWRREDDWTKAWRVPRFVRGMRMVSLLGDAEDRRSVTAEAIDGMMVDSLSVVMRKYGAPALALAVTDGRSVALAGYVPGRAASWIPATVEGDASATREKSVAVLASLFGAGPMPAAPDEPASQRFDVEVMAQRDTPEGFDYRIRLRATGEPQARRMLQGAGMTLAQVESTEGETMTVVASSADDLDQVTAAMKTAGLTVR